jgi:cyclic beta-1,2-glucan synthetase
MLSGQLDRFAGGSATVPAPRRARRPSASRASKIDLEFANEFGGFVDQAREYAITIEGDQRPPAPWINVVANPSFGFHVAADGASYTWSVNSRDNQITPWSNDPVINRSGETLYIRDDESGELWGPTAHPWQNQAGSYRAFHGRGYSRFEHAAAEIASELTSFVPLDDSLKIMRLKLRNLSARPRRLSVAAYMEWVLATSRAQSAASIVTEMSPGGTLMARNPRNQAYPHRLAFLGLRRGEATWTGDRSEFLGRHGSTADPAALVAGGALSNRIGAGLDPCGALLTQVALAPGEEREVTIFLGDAVAVGDADALIEKYRSANLDAVFAAVKSHWDEVLGAVTVATPDRSMDLMLNGWLLYQTLACRMWARSGFYQASGAFGFRDQLQDCLALVFAAPNLAREHILRAAARQFVEGDLQHWWLPASGQGVRTRIAVDPVWLAYAVAEYVSATGDATILDETVPYLEGPRLAEHEHDAFFAPEVSGKTASVYQHCVEALQQSAAIGERGLPLMRGGDWNDGMNRVGIGGKGESVWLAWFRYRTLLDFAAIAERRGDATIAADWTSQAQALARAAEDNAWDGAWYRRAYFDDGTPLGSSTNQECRIDSIAQSWAVISGAAPAERASGAVAEVERQLVKPAEKLALLFAPPFDQGAHDPGYIKGYPPGLRENGGQYPHGAIWLIVAEALQGNGDQAAALFAMLNPNNRTLTADDVDRYKVEPYVVVADVYSAEGLVGRGGWTWYTGSAGWLYRAGVEWILGLRRAGDSLRIAPSIPRDWPGFRATLRRGAATYHVAVENPQGHAGTAAATLTFDGKTVDAAQATIPYVDDGAEHHATQVLARRD